MPDMQPRELTRIREKFQMGRREFGFLIGLTGEASNVWTQVKRYETGQKPIPEYFARMALMLSWFHDDFGWLPDLDMGARVPMPRSAEDARG